MQLPWVTYKNQCDNYNNVISPDTRLQWSLVIQILRNHDINVSWEHEDIATPRENKTPDQTDLQAYWLPMGPETDVISKNLSSIEGKKNLV